MTLPYYTEAPKPTTEQLAEIVRLEESAKRSLRLREESFQRSDTDGFLSQWAHSIGADLDRQKIQVLQNGGCWRFPVLCDAEGNVIATKVYRFPDRYAPWKTVRRWRLPDDLAAKHGRKWIPTAYMTASRIQKQLGLHEEDRWFPAEARITTGGRKNTGLSGCANAFVAVFKEGEGED